MLSQRPSFPDIKLWNALDTTKARGALSCGLWHEHAMPCQSIIPCPSRSPLMHLGKQWVMARVPASLHSHGGPRWSFWFLALALAQTWLLQPFGK